jgi:hypothetical protein
MFLGYILEGKIAKTGFWKQEIPRISFKYSRISCFPNNKKNMLRKTFKTCNG